GEKMEAIRGQRNRAEAERNTARAELTGAYRGAEELRGMYRDLRERATEIERQRDQLVAQRNAVIDLAAQEQNDAAADVQAGGPIDQLDDLTV
ncbi:hypothetical protein G3I24_43590, partial [Micromonospora aurantiaca]|nr:hypothetical protein [Micromonospora aurantiaca]